LLIGLLAGLPLHLSLSLFSFSLSWRRGGTKQGGEIYRPPVSSVEREREREREREQKGNKGTLAGTQH